MNNMVQDGDDFGLQESFLFYNRTFKLVTSSLKTEAM